MEASLLMQQCYTGTMGEAPDSVSVFAPFCWFSSDGTSVALRFGHWGMGEAPDESVVSLGLHTGATFDSEVPRRRGSKYQHKKSSCVKTFLPTFHRSSISLYLLWAPLLLRHGFRILCTLGVNSQAPQGSGLLPTARLLRRIGVLITPPTEYKLEIDTGIEQIKIKRSALFPANVCWRVDLGPRLQSAFLTAPTYWDSSDTGRGAGGAVAGGAWLPQPRCLQRRDVLGSASRPDPASEPRRVLEEETICLVRLQEPEGRGRLCVLSCLRQAICNWQPPRSSPGEEEKQRRIPAWKGPCGGTGGLDSHPGELGSGRPSRLPAPRLRGDRGTGLGGTWGGCPIPGGTLGSSVTRALGKTRSLISFKSRKRCCRVTEETSRRSGGFRRPEMTLQCPLPLSFSERQGAGNENEPMVPAAWGVKGQTTC
ncbi:uncharacterized protein LOC119870444 [Canis lupus familiaris]|uniref:uncharacterized protein LOC119870444 n=1 Tax=Canis lupus familiaris TaxID=9615 RepID=UPI0018F45876|nr:uncharacterized protein LOC119870444 [Canis lupus familiaris]